MPIVRHVEFLYLDLDDCARCGDTEANLLSALDIARGRLEGHGVAVEFDRVHVTGAEVAVRHRFLSSPTVRVDGRDIAGTLIESSCEADACRCADGAPIDCRDWRWDGEIHPVPPVALLVEAIVAPSPDDPAGDAGSYTMPENLRAFFGTESECCDEASRETCCDPGVGSDCCAPGAADCGCR